MAEQRTCRDGAVTGGVKTIEAGVVVVGLGQRVLPHTSARRDRSTVALCDHNGMGHGGNTGKLSRSTKPSRQHRISHITAGGAGGARTRDRQIMRKPTRLTSPLDGDLLTALPLVSRDAPGLAGMSRNQPRWDGCSHNVLTRRYSVEVASLRRTTSSPWRIPC